MARNRITGRETQKMQEYTQGQISQAERRGIEFPTDVKEQLFEYANLIGEEEKVRTLVRNLADAVIQADEEGVEDLLDDARMDIQDLPDPTIGKLELRDYGYTAEDMVPLRKEAALDYHRMQNHVLPYLQSFCNLEEKGVKERREQQIAERYEGRADERVTSTEANEVVKDVGKTDRKPAQQKQAVDGKDKKLSIHERLEINKRIIQEKQGKDKTERGVDLGVRTV